MTDGEHLCPVCGKHIFKENDSFDFCRICRWIDDAGLTAYPDLKGYYKMSLNEAKIAYQNGQEIE